jgi:hypothetical protein
MNPIFPLSDVIIRRVTETRKVIEPLHADSFWQMNQQEFAMQVQGVGNFYACEGREIEYAPAEGATLASVELFLNGSVYGAILHQRNILPLHGSSFVYNGQGILLCGESGAGKSSLTAAFCLAGAEFLTDDVTPLVFEDDIPMIVPLSDRIKLWNDSLSQLKQENSNLSAISSGHEKYYFPMQNDLHQKYPLHRVFLIEAEETNKTEFYKLEGIKLFAALRNEIYRWEYLSAMQQTEISYIEKLISISRLVNVYKVVRPRTILIEEMAGHLRRHMDKTSEKTNEIASKVL